MSAFHIRGLGPASALAACLALAACGRSSSLPNEAGAPADGQSCTADSWCVGAAKAVITPTQEQIDGISESRLYAGSKLQQFNLGGFGINPLQNLPDPLAQFGTRLTQPAQLPVYVSERFHETENTYARVSVLELGDTRVAFVALDAIGAGNLIQAGMREALVAASCAVDWCIDADHIIFGQTHSHASADLQGLRGGVPQDWIDNVLYAGTAQALQKAIAERARADATVATGLTNDFNNYRRPHIDVNADADAHMAMLTFNHAGTHQPIARILQYVAHPTAIDEDPRIPHADYIFGLAERLERDGGVALYYNGPIADASGAGGDCTYADPNAYEKVRCRGEAIADFALAQQARPLKPELAIRNVEVTLPVTNPLFLAAAPIGAFNRYYNFTPQALETIPGLGDVLANVQTEIGQVPSVAQSLVTRLSLGGEGGLEIATIPGEGTNTFGEFIRGLAENTNPGADVMLLGLTQNSFGYIIPEEEFNYLDASGNTGFLIPFTNYEEFVSLGPLTAPLLRMQAYIPLFDAPASAYIPEYLRACSSPASEACVLTDIAQNISYIQRSFAQQCADAGAPAAFCGLLQPQTPLADACLQLGLLPADLCAVLGNTTP